MHWVLRDQLQRALDQRELQVHYQPKFHLATGALQGVEALLRWQTHAGVWISPETFVPVLEETGMIDEVGTWLFERTATDSAYWRSHGQSVVRMAINVSPVQLRRKEFLSWVLSTCGSWRALDTGLDIELTESTLLPQSNEFVTAMHALAAANVRLALDDFGTGYSSLGLLMRLPVRHLKIDRSFVAQMSSSRKALAVVEAIIRMGREIGLETIAEGIETGQQLQHLRALGCDIGQGYYFSPALCRDELLTHLQSIDTAPRSGIYPPRQSHARAVSGIAG
ncbi:MAG: EAL domain-containing protein [Gammaproteobacteria bacterium]